jgi:hypothetical protein
MENLLEKVLAMETLLHCYESRVAEQDKLLERILVCLNAAMGGDSRYGIGETAEAIVQEIYLNRLQFAPGERC